ncbi:NlpC/P60 family protein [Aquibacillus sp. 3ASR75-11]|uniref:NlpC/P60 family protein n=1 Tax=Terrihalobacillus insolitus TaxID=2950438 RepID=A0A9X3WQH3_9BACI|nr:C40 family peptidase [Terrihalobacillus insolitus]MDC3412309.1 NlpC/P60 family protein [Terrihalobacillus insolitus]MDC3422998.1 NlpC/P60 family protein [Terrihalobacillus insolitus]
MVKDKLAILGILVVVVLATTVTDSPKVQAETKTKDQIEEERTEIKEKISQANEEIGQAQSELEALTKQIERVKQAVIDNQKTIDETKQKIDATKSEVNKLDKETSALERSINERYNILKERAKSIQQSGGDIGYLEVVFGSTSFGDFVNRLFAVAKIMEADASLIEGIERSKEELEEKKNAVEKKLDNLTSMKTELEGMQGQILEQKKQNELLVEQLKQKKQGNLALKAALQQEDSSLVEQASNLEQTTEKVETSKPQVKPLSLEQPKQEQQKSSNEDTSKLTDTNDKIQTLINSGYKYIGNSVYVFGGGRNAYDIANGRFDCSGFIKWAFAQAGVNVGASTDILKYEGRQVSPADMRPGDLVFYDTYKIDGHAGIYMGDGKFIGSQSSTGVAIVDMSNTYWKQRFNGRVVRIIE